MTTKLLRDNILKQVRDVFAAQMKEPVEIIFFGKNADCEQCADTRQLIEEMATASDKLHLSMYDMELDNEIARQYHVDKAPSLVLAARDGDQVRDYGIRFAGIPAGYEFSSLIQGIILVSGRDSGLKPQTRQLLGKVTKPTLLQVFVTPT